MSKHTPGPWNTDEKEHDELYQEIKIKHGSRTICTVWMDDAPVHDYNAEQKLNARLIAATPELLNVLKEMIAVHDEPCHFDHHGYCQSHYLDDVNNGGCRVANAKAAIAKATGA